MSTISSQQERLIGLDALRGLAALAVVLFHYSTSYQMQIGHADPLPFHFYIGNYGVQLFFLISGFVIFMTLERTRRASDFVVSRFSRLFPAYWSAICLTLLTVTLIGLPQQQLPARDLLANFSMVQEFFGFRSIDGSYWTLEIELFFYVQMLFWYLLGMLERIRWIIVGWLALVLVYGLFVHNGWHFSYSVRELLILEYIPFFAIGILFYRIRTRPHETAANALLIGACMLVIGAVYRPDFFWVALTCVLIFTAFISGRLDWLGWRPLAFLGGISYSLYLLHQAIGFALIYRFQELGMPSVVACALTIACVILLAWGLNVAVEKPAMRWLRDRWRDRVRRVQAPQH